MQQSTNLEMVLVLGVALGGLSCNAESTTPQPGPPPPGAELTPLTDLGSNRYLGFVGGLYPAGQNVPPGDHLKTGHEHASRIRPLNAAGMPDPGGKYVLLSVGMSNAAQEFCGDLGIVCGPDTFIGQAQADNRVDRTKLIIVNGAQGGEDASAWNSPTEPTFDRVRDDALSPLGLSELQVQIAWLKQANKRPMVSLPAPNADAIALEADLGRIVRAMAVRYPNLQLIFITSRTYGGYATTSLNPEPYAYESGFAVKWLIEAQIRQMRSGEVDPIAGDLQSERYPWVGWGPYIWTAGTEGRSDGFTWELADVASDGTHPSASGERKVGKLLLDFFTSAPLARCWFVSGQTC